LLIENRVTLTCIIYKNADCSNRRTGYSEIFYGTMSFRKHDRNLMRVSVSMFNNRNDIQQLLAFLESLV